MGFKAKISPDASLIFMFNPLRTKELRFTSTTTPIQHLEYLFTLTPFSIPPKKAVASYKKPVT